MNKRFAREWRSKSCLFLLVNLETCTLKELILVSSLILLHILKCSTYMKLFFYSLMNITFLQVGGVEAERFCKAFEKLHKKLVCVVHFLLKTFIADSY